MDLLGEAATDPDYNVHQRARWGLTYGIASPEGRAKAADLFLDLLRNDSRNAEEALGALSAYGTARHLEALEDLAKSPDTPDPLAKQIEGAATRLRQRLGRG